MLQIILISFIAVYRVVALPQNVGMDCQLRNGAIGVCQRVEKCVSDGKFGAISYDSYCDPYGNRNTVCCHKTPAKRNSPSMNKYEMYDGVIVFPDHDYYNEYETHNDNRNKPYIQPDPPKVDQSTRKAVKACQEYTKKKLLPIGPNIIDGQKVNDGDYPHMVAIGLLKDSGLSFECGGVLISDRYVLTAAHCVENQYNIQPSVVRMGTIEINGNFDTSSTDYDVEENIVHPEYKRKYKYYDIALLKLNKPVKFTINKHPACLNTEEEVSGKTLMIVGWGETDPNKVSPSNTLMKGNVTSLTNSQCSEIYAKKSGTEKFAQGIVPEHICARGYLSRQDTCGGDSGGPLQDSMGKDMFKIIGITSFSFGKCGSQMGTVYTRVSSYLDWIESKVWP